MSEDINIGLKEASLITITFVVLEIIVGLMSNNPYYGNYVFFNMGDLGANFAFIVFCIIVIGAIMILRNATKDIVIYDLLFGYDSILESNGGKIAAVIFIIILAGMILSSVSYTYDLSVSDDDYDDYNDYDNYDTFDSEIDSSLRYNYDFEYFTMDVIGYNDIDGPYNLSNENMDDIDKESVTYNSKGGSVTVDNVNFDDHIDDPIYEDISHPMWYSMSNTEFMIEYFDYSDDITPNTKLSKDNLMSEIYPYAILNSEHDNIKVYTYTDYAYDDYGHVTIDNTNKKKMIVITGKPELIKQMAETVQFTG